MADRTSAALFGMIFMHLAKNPTPENISFARQVFAMREDYDFSPYQMGCDEALATLGLKAERG